MSRANLEPLRSLAFGGISGTYAAIGTASSNPIRLFCISNNTEGDMIFSRDNTIAAGELFVAAGSYKLFDIQSNMTPEKESKFVFDQGTQFWVKQSTAPVSGSVYVEILY
ncbi:MAG: hypothetical protein KAS32_30545 [Candidatus Peribacteraceae bacterium]|nr:hypothetical protein [Candidatus Peribacteraceae bacterium]